MIIEPREKHDGAVIVVSNAELVELLVTIGNTSHCERHELVRDKVMSNTRLGLYAKLKPLAGKTKDSIFDSLLQTANTNANALFGETKK